MNFQFYFEKLKNSEEFEKFVKENPSAFLCSAFFSIDKKGNDNKQHFDFFVGDKIYSFQLEDNSKKTELENYSQQTPEKLDEEVDFDFDEIEKIVLEKLKTEEIKENLQKLLISLQNLDEKTWIIGTIFLSGMGMASFKIGLEKMEIIDFEKKSIFDMMKIIKK